jgi:hypothetical protein
VIPGGLLFFIVVVAESCAWLLYMRVLSSRAFLSSSCLNNMSAPTASHFLASGGSSPPRTSRSSPRSSSAPPPAAAGAFVPTTPLARSRPLSPLAAELLAKVTQAAESPPASGVQVFVASGPPGFSRGVGSCGASCTIESSVFILAARRFLSLCPFSQWWGLTACHLHLPWKGESGGMLARLAGRSPGSLLVPTRSRRGVYPSISPCIRAICLCPSSATYCPPPRLLPTLLRR